MAKSGPVERASDRWASIVLSVLLHGVLVAAIAYGWWTYKHERPAPTLAIEATVVDARSVPGIGKPPPQPQPSPPPPVQPPETQQAEPDGPPPPTPEELAKREQAQKEEAEREAQAKQQEAKQQRAEQERQQKAAEEKRAAEQRQAQEKTEAERKAREAAEAKKRAEEKRLEEERRQAEEQSNAEREADLRRSLDQEMRQDTARSSAAVASWESAISARIRRAWLQPPSARQGIVCELTVTQEPGGQVTSAHVGVCNGDAAVRESIEAAAYRASPLPPPPDPSLFERTLEITFRPN